MNLDSVIEWFAIGVGYVGFIAFTVIAVRWTSIIRQYDNLAAAWRRETEWFPPDTYSQYFLRNIARAENGAKEARKNRRMTAVTAILMFIYGTVMVRLAVIG